MRPTLGSSRSKRSCRSTAPSGKGVGVVGELHFFFDDIFPDTLGKPIFRRQKMTNAVCLCSFAALLALPSAAFAHAQLEEATPPSAARSPAPREIRLEFSEGVEPKFSGVDAQGPGGAASRSASRASTPATTRC